MKIAQISATVHRLPIRPPALDYDIHREIVLVRLTTEEGVTGYGMTSQILRHSVADFINRELGPFLIGHSILETERNWEEMYWRFNQRATSGVVQSSISAVDIASWDAKGKALGQPTWRLLGGYSSRVPTYVTFGLTEYDRDTLASVAVDWVREGHRRLKLVVGAHWGLDEDARRVRAVREAVGDDVELMIDANQLLNPAEARRLCKKVEEYDICWFEEPLWGNDTVRLAELRRQTSIPIAAGQNEGHRWRQRELMAGGAVDIAQANVVYVGGYTEGQRVAHMAQGFSLPFANGGGWPHHNAVLHAAVANGWRVEFHVAMWRAGELIWEAPPPPVDGWVTLGDAPGLGLEPREDALRDTLEA